MVTEVSAGGVLLDDGDIFLLHKPNGEWVMPKGHLESGETPEQAAVREVLEETGLTARIVAKVGETRYQFRAQPGGQVKRKRVHWFLMKIDNRKLDVEPTFEEGVFLPVEDALKTLTFENDKDIARKAVEWHGRRAPTNRAPARRDADHTPS